MRHNIIIDTDPGDDIDDILTIAFALQRPELDIKAITTVTYGAPKRADLVRGLLETVRRTDIPIGSGMELPLGHFNRQQYAIMTDNDGYVLNHYADTMKREEAQADAIALILDTVNKHPGDIGIVTLGPLTNVAVALRKDPSIAPKISWIASMGGEIQVYRAEHNITWDPVAADIVLTAGIPVFLGTWDVTRQVVVSEEDCRRIGQQPTDMCRYLAECIRMWWPYKKLKPGPVMFDIAPIIWSFDKSLYSVRPLDLRVETAGALTRGVTVPQALEGNIQVSVSVDAERVRTMFMDTICGTAEPSVSTGPVST